MRKLWFLVLLFICAGSLFISAAISEFDIAHKKLGSYTLGVMRYCGKDTSHIDSAWIEGYKDVEKSFVAAGFLAGAGCGLMFGCLLFAALTIEKLKPKETEKNET